MLSATSAAGTTSAPRTSATTTTTNRPWRPMSDPNGNPGRRSGFRARRWSSGFSLYSCWVKRANATVCDSASANHDGQTAQAEAGTLANAVSLERLTCGELDTWEKPPPGRGKMQIASRRQCTPLSRSLISFPDSVIPRHSMETARHKIHAMRKMDGVMVCPADPLSAASVTQACAARGNVTFASGRLEVSIRARIRSQRWFL